MNFTCKNDILIQNSQIWCTHVQVEIFISNHEEICFDPKWSTILEFWWKKQVQAKMGLSMSWEVRWRKHVLGLEKCVSSRSEKWWSEWKVEFWVMEVFLTWKFWFVNEIFLKWMLDPLFLIKNVFVFSHLDSSLTFQRKMMQMRLKGSKCGVYVHS